jgi:hypothetical protein
MQVEFKMKYIQHWTDHLGRKRFRFRRRGFQRIELPVDSDPGSVEFQAAYHAALRGEKTNAVFAAIAARGGSGSVKDAIERYLVSTTFNDDYSPSTKALRRSILNSVSRLVGNHPLAQMNRNYIERWLETSPTKGVKRTRLLAIKPFMKWAVESVHLIASDPTEGIKVKVRETDGHATWTDEQIEQYRWRRRNLARSPASQGRMAGLHAGEEPQAQAPEGRDADTCVARGRHRSLPEPAQLADVPHQRVGPPLRQEELQHLVPQANGRSRASGYVRPAWPAQGNWSHHGRERLHAARNHVGSRPLLAQGSRALHQGVRQEEAGRPSASQGRGRKQRRAAGRRG